MRSLASLILALAACAAAPPTFHAGGGGAGAWPEILGSVGFQPASADRASILVVRAGDPMPAPGWQQRIENGSFFILEGDSDAARVLGFRPASQRARVLSVVETRNPGLEVVWERAVEAPVYEIPQKATVFAKEKWSGAPLVAGFRSGSGGVLWTALPPGPRGYERFPYLLHALADLGLSPPFRSRRLWAFFDSSYRLRADPDYLAGRWKLAGIRGLHVAAWHSFEPDPETDAYLRRLIESCHRQGILVYAWLELPHVSSAFWEAHPEWREKTALLQDAQLDWRKLMNLANRDCFQAAAAGVRRLIQRFDWDGVDLAELYFESLEGYQNPSRFTPMNDDVRRGFRQSAGFDPLDLFDASSPRHYARNPGGLRAFLDYRAQLSQRIQVEWLDEMERLRETKPDLEIILTHVDDRLDPDIRDAVGANAASLLPLLGRLDFTFLIEDPATVWHLGPERYSRLAADYRTLTSKSDRLAIDVNIAERYQNVYPTKQQTGTELFQVVSRAARAFPRVALYPEHALQTADLAWVAAAAAAGRYKGDGRKLEVDSAYGLGIPWQGPALVDGHLWPVLDSDTLWIPAGRHVVAPATRQPPAKLLDFTGDLIEAASLPDGLEFTYRSSGRALAMLDWRPERILVDGVRSPLQTLETSPQFALWLPRGRHTVRFQSPAKK
jgi:hypothetical protein